MTKEYPKIVNSDGSEMSFEEYAEHDFGMTADQLLEVMRRIVGNAELGDFVTAGTVENGVHTQQVTKIPRPGQSSTG